MARLRRRRQASRQATWRKGLVFNGLLFLVALLGAQIITTAYKPDGVAGVNDTRAIAETRQAIDEAFAMTVPARQDARTFWAQQISGELAARDFSAARGYLLAAPVMLERDDARAIQAAATAEVSGSEDERLVKAALLFLPNATRAEYQRATEPPGISLAGQRPRRDTGTTRPGESESERGGARSSGQRGRNQLLSPEILPTEEYESTGPAAFLMTGDGTDLVRRAQRWINGDAADSMQIRLSAISLLDQARPDTGSRSYTRAISVVNAGARARRLTPEYRDYLAGRLDLAMPRDEVREAVRTALKQVAPLAQLEEQVLAAFERAIDPDGLEELQTDLARIDRIAELTSPAGAVTLLETARSPDDVRKLELISEAGGDRAVALAKQIGSRVITMARMGVNWSPALGLKLAGLALSAIFLIWITVIAVRKVRPASHA